MSITKKIFLIIAIILVLIAVALFFFSKKTPPPADQSQIPGQLPIGTFKMPSPTDPTMTIITPQGANIKTNNVYKDALYPLSQNGVAFHNNTDYYAAFYPQDQGFLLVLHDQDIKSAKAKAEAEFLQKLGISKEQACMLKVSITIPASVSEQYSGQVYGLSFCPGAKTF